MIMRTSFLAAAAALVLAGPAAARCVQPYAPVLKINASTTKQEMMSLRSDMASFIAASDVYQKCLVEQGANRSLLDANQAEKERLAREFNSAVRAFNVASNSKG
jgi:hypothetical protein